MRRRTLLGAATAGLASLAGCGVGRSFRTLPAAGSYPQPQYDAANTNYNPTTGVSGSPVVNWTVDIPPLAPFPPVVADGRVYVANRAYDQTDGSELWTAEVSGRYGQMVVADGSVYTRADPHDEEARLDALSAETGDVLREVSPSDLLAGRMTVADGSIYVPLKLGEADEAPQRIAAFDAESGDHRWTASDGDGVVSPVAVADGTVFVGDNLAETFSALDAEDGSVRWRTEEMALYDSSTVADGTVYVRPSNSRLVALATADGSRRWERQFGSVGSVAAGDDTLYASVRDGEDSANPPDATDSRLVALDAATGETRWRAEVPAVTTPTLTDDLLYVGLRPEHRTGAVAAFDPSSGEEQWRFSRSESYDGDLGTTPPIPVSTPPVVVEGGLFVVIGTTIYALG